MRKPVVAAVTLGVALWLASAACLAGGEARRGPANVTLTPDKTSIKPGEEIVLTIKVLDESLLPLQVSPELDNDKYREPSVHLDSATARIEFTYGTANLYMPYIEVDNGRNYREKIYSDHLVSVNPDLEKRTSMPISLPSPQGSVTCDYVKAMTVHTFDYTLFGTPAGEAFIQGELDRVRGLGCNTVVYTSQWFIDGLDSSVSEPIYGDAWPACWVGTLPVAALVELADWTHQRGMRVFLRSGLWLKGDHSGVQKASWEPGDPDLYLALQAEQKTAYARLCEALGIELYSLDCENDYFTKAAGVAAIIQAVRGVYDGLVTNSTANVLGHLACPYVDKLDLLCWSDYLFFTQNVGSELTGEQLGDLFCLHYQADVAYVLERFRKPGIVFETGVNIADNSQATVERQYTAYLEAFARLQADGAPLCGHAWWVWNLTDPQREPHAMRGQTAEGILRDYLRAVIRDSYEAHLPGIGLATPAVGRYLQTFENGLPHLEMWWQGSEVAAVIAGASPRTGHCVRFDLEPTSSADYRLGYIWSTLPKLMDWSAYSSVNFWVKSANANWGLRVNLLDGDGDNVSTLWWIDSKPLLVAVLPETGGWHLVSVPLSLFAKPAWDTAGNGTMDWGRVKSWGIGVFYKDQGAQTVWVDDVYLSREGLAY